LHFIYNILVHNETNFIFLFVRNSRATGPKTLLPIGLPFAFNKTTEFLLKFIVEPSSLDIFFFTRTIIALYISFFFTLLKAFALFIETTMISPGLPKALGRLPKTLIH
jgi:hypothetical protein